MASDLGGGRATSQSDAMGWKSSLTNMDFNSLRPSDAYMRQ